MDSVQRDVDRDFKGMLEDVGMRAKVEEWWDLMWMEKDMTLTEVRRLGMIESDGVHTPSEQSCCRVAMLQGEGDASGQGGPAVDSNNERTEKTEESVEDDTRREELKM